MKVGFNLLLWNAFITEDEHPVIEKLKKTGFDGVEVPVFGGEVEHYEKLGKVIKDNDLACAAVTIIPDEEHNPVSPDAKHRAGGVEHMKWAIDCCEALGAEVLSGPFYQVLGSFTGQPPTEEEKQWAAEVHRDAAEYAAKANVALGVEFLNRFECYFLNTLEASAEHVKRVNHPNFGVLFDTFHANIEESDPVGCIGKHIDAIKHVHTSENHRGMPGTGHVDWAGTFKALKSNGYDGWLVTEAFGNSLPELAATTCVWRDYYEGIDDVPAQTLKFIKEGWEAA